jgi:hypothetical protein
MKKTVTIFFPNGTVTVYEENRNCVNFWTDRNVVLVVKLEKTILRLVNIPFFINHHAV